MQDTANQNAGAFLPVKHNVLALRHAPQPKANFMTRATESGIIGKKLATIFKLADITVGLDFTPGAKGIKSDVEQIGFGTMGKMEPAHGLTGRRGKVELLTNTLKNIAFGNAAGVAFIDGGPQRDKLSLVSLFLTLQGPQCCANDFTGVLIAPALDLLQHKVVKLIGQINVTGWHGGVLSLGTHRVPRLAKIANAFFSVTIANDWVLLASALVSIDLDSCDEFAISRPRRRTSTIAGEDAGHVLSSRGRRQSVNRAVGLTLTG